MERTATSRDPNAVATHHLLRFLPTLLLEHIARRTIQDEGPALDRSSARRVFELVDVDQSGAVSVSELMRASGMLGLKVARSRLEEVLREVDIDQSGQLEFEEFVEVLRFAKPSSINSLSSTPISARIAGDRSLSTSAALGRRGLPRGGTPAADRMSIGDVAFDGTPALGRRSIGSPASPPSLRRRSSEVGQSQLLGDMMRKAVTTLQANESEPRQRLTAAFAVVELSGLHELTEDLPTFDGVDPCSPRHRPAHAQVREQARGMLSSAARRLLDIAHQSGGDVARFTAEGMLLIWVYDATQPGAARAAAITACRCMIQLRELDQALLYEEPGARETGAAVPPPPISPSALRGARRQTARAAAAALGCEMPLGPRAVARRRPPVDRWTEALRRAAFEAGSFDALHLGSITSLELDPHDHLLQIVDAPMTGLEREQDPWALPPVAADVTGRRKASSLGMARLGVAGGVGIGGLYGVRLGEAEGDEVLGAPLMQVFWGEMLDELTRTVQMHGSAGDIIISQDLLALATDALILTNVPPSVSYQQSDFEAPSSLLLLQHVSADAEGVATGDAAQARAAAIGGPSLEDRTSPDALLHWLADPERTRATAALMAARARHLELGPGGNATVVPPAEAEGAAEIAVEGLRLRESTVLAFRIQLRLQSLDTLLRSQEAVRTLARTLKAHGAALHYAYQTSQGTIAVASLTPEVPTQPSHRHRRAVATAVAAQAALRASGVEAFLGVSSGTVAIGVAGLSEVEEARFKSTAIDLDAVCVAVSDPPAKSSTDTPLIESTSSGAPESLAAPADQAAAATETITPHKTAPGAGGAPAPPPSAVGAPYRLACIIAGRPVKRALMLANSARRGGPTMLIGRLTAQGARSHQPLTKIAAVERRGGASAFSIVRGVQTGQPGRGRSAVRPATRRRCVFPQGRR